MCLLLCSTVASDILKGEGSCQWKFPFEQLLRMLSVVKCVNTVIAFEGIPKPLFRQIIRRELHFTGRGWSAVKYRNVGSRGGCKKIKYL